MGPQEYHLRVPEDGSGRGSEQPLTVFHTVGREATRLVVGGGADGVDADGGDGDGSLLLIPRTLLLLLLLPLL